MNKKLNDHSKQIGSSTKLAHLTKKGANSYGIIRLVATILVIWTHSYRVVGGPEINEPLLDFTGFSAGSHAVNVFFSLSGLMVAASWQRSRNIFDFLCARILRILPALIFANLIIIILCGTLITVMRDKFWSIENVSGFLWRTIITFQSSATLAGVFNSNPWENFINIPIWTIKYEIICYISLIIIMKITDFDRRSQAHKTLILLSIVASSAFIMASQGESSQFGFAGNLARFLFAFYIGVAAWYERDIIQLRTDFLLFIWLVISVAVFIASTIAIPLVIIGTAYTAFWAGGFLLGRLQKAADRTDLSYGMYISGFFIQQWLILAFPQQTIFANTLSAVSLAAMFAWVSWNLIERPALKLRGPLSRWATMGR
jgi:peptidoglycan/LPS O-acetylase OafA/YrhL